MKVSTVEHDGRADGVIRVQIHFDESEVRVEETPAGLTVSVDGCSNAGVPGAPALPRTTIRVALPEEAWPTALDIGDERTIRLTDKPAVVTPIQRLRPGVDDDDRPGKRPKGQKGKDESGPVDDVTEVGEAGGADGDHLDRDQQGKERERERSNDRRFARSDDEDEFVAEPFPVPTFVPPDSRLYEDAVADQRRVQPTGFGYLGLFPILAVELRPVRYTPDGLLELTTDLELFVRYGPRPEPDDRGREEAIERLRKRGFDDIDPERVKPMPTPTVASGAQARRLVDLAKDLVVNPDLVKVVDRFPWLDLPADYLVITDNQTWDAATITPTGSVSGDMVASFRRLVTWKRSRGLTAKVVTVTDIVNGRFGDFRSGSRDIQEVIRKFLVWAHEHWGVAWLLIGGDVDVVPPRIAAGALEGHMDLTDDDPPGDNRSHWTGSYLRMHVVSPGTWWPGSWPRTLVNAETGRLIPYDTTGASASGGIGWYYTTSDTYATRTAMATNFVRVNGPAWVANARLQWLYEWNQIPTDFYYASLQSWVIAYEEIGFWLFSIQVPYVYYPPHAWDALGNGIYGQYVGGSDVDGVHFQTELSVGRAPVQSAAEADAFVDKVIAYEHFEAPDGSWLDGDWPRRLVLASSNWGDGVTVTSTAASPPGDNRFKAGASRTLIRLKDMPPDYKRQLIADISDSDRREMPWNVGGGNARGWHYATSASDDTPPVFSFSFFGISFSFPVPSQWIVVHGAAEELNPRSYLFDSTDQDGSMADQEHLREQLRTEIPGWDQVTRLYKDETDLTAAQMSAAPIQHLTSDRIRAAMNAGPHVVSLSGHGNSDGCCGTAVWMASALTNGWNSFIGYADSCLTNQIDAEDAFSEALLKNPSGGAVAYVGNTRFSWIGIGDDLQRAFFHRLTTTRHIGLANDSKTYSMDFSYWHAYARWIMYALNLMGDPEMPVWRSRRNRLSILTKWKSRINVPLKVLVRKPKPGEPNEDVVVHVRQGESEWIARPDSEGLATIDLSGATLDPLVLTVSGPDLVPHVETLVPDGPRWVTGPVVAVRHRDPGNRTSIVIETGDGPFTALAMGDDPDYAIVLDAATDAFTTGQPIGLLVGGSGEAATIERFRFDREDAARS
ncbi:MAG TPA: C25 family cysteine peptidase [Candidatus Limnocylindrales bacterium]|nr:C25 family cysteine peptidase [Candidatus Limnocylindrales bacterium]